MTLPRSPHLPRRGRWSALLLPFALLAALLLSVVSALHICSSACGPAHNFRLFGLPFEAVGIPFFSLLLVLSLFPFQSPAKRQQANTLIAAGLVAAVGAELLFIGIQKFSIGSWCPVCLSIAGSVALATVAAFGRLSALASSPQQGGTLSMGMISLRTFPLLLSVGFALSWAGLSYESELQAAEVAVQQKIAFGDQSSPVTVYFFTDWFCPPCRKLEPVIERITPELMDGASVIFVDMPLHPESMNFIPYNVSFMVNNKQDYIKLREMLSQLAEKTSKPTDEEVSATARKLGITYQELPFSNIALAVDYFQELAAANKIEGTPTVVVVNNKTKEKKILSGGGEITASALTDAVKALR